jgi:hypothetical protein
MKFPLILLFIEHDNEKTVLMLKGFRKILYIRDFRHIFNKSQQQVDRKGLFLLITLGTFLGLFCLFFRDGF